MTPDTVFQMASSLALLAWLCLGVGTFQTQYQNAWLTVGGRLLPICLSIMYLGMIIRYWHSVPDGGFTSLEQVARLFSESGNLAAGWLHFLAFDLLIGRWMIDKVQTNNARKWPLLVCLPFTFWFGPVGLLLYLVCYFKPQGKQNALL
ncbi:ABA4-like family protein [Motilimonas pumila]|uniref:DUF4281 domain-containing protein n=1 Tax=Motilimonas pumila TaxID=2303987 RepID=A0A418Y9Z4_9GAMM|nr:ABA4-like family protein [Motilimonas pumila]RJG38608.1 DUF4281 domain-containing protein [Motilimonas pumila]